MVRVPGAVVAAEATTAAAGGGAGISDCYAGGGAGGGGSSYIEPRAKSFRGWQGWKNAVGNGLIVISW